MTPRIPWWAPVWAEFTKLWALRLVPGAYVGLVFFTLLIAIQLFHYEHMATRYSELGVHEPLNALIATGFLLYGAWGKLFILPLFLIIFGGYSVAVESQYGMTRIVATQPLSRLRYAASKFLALALHGALLGFIFCCLLLAWAFVFTGLRNGNRDQWVAFFLCAGLMMVMCIAWTCFSAAAALFRRSLLGAVVVAFGALFAFVWMTIGNNEFGPYNWLRYYSYPMHLILPLSWQGGHPNADEPIWKYLLVMLATPALLFAASAAYFCRRDITE